MIPVNTVKESMNNVMHMQSMYLLDEQGTVLVSGGNEQAQNLQMPKLQGTVSETHETNGAWMVRSGLLQEGGMTLVSLVPRDVLVQESGRIIREMLICYGIICALTFVLLQLGSRQALAGYTGWKFEYVKCDWSNCFDKLENGEIDIMGDISYTDERAQRMLFSDEAMGEEKYILYADLSNLDIGTYDFKFMDGKRIGVLMGTEPEIMLTEWENKNGIHTEHVNVNNDNDVEKKLANHEIDAFVSLEESIWSEQGISSVTTIGKSGIYFAINKERSDIKTELDYAMRQLDQDSPFFKADLYKKYFTLFQLS